ncbi:hypothetical protein FB107DRAFT_210926 [Schizophyllum commune]
MQSSHRIAASLNDLFPEAFMRSFGLSLPPWPLAAAPLEWRSNMIPASDETALPSSIRPAGYGTQPQQILSDKSNISITDVGAPIDVRRLRDFEQENSALRARLLVFNGACMRRLDALETHMTHLAKALKSAIDLKTIPSNVDESVATTSLALSAIIVPPLVQLERAQCPNVTYYEQNDWIIAKKKPKPTSSEPAKRGKAYISQNVNATMLYVTDEDGRPVDGQRTVEIRETFRALLRQLRLLKLLAPKWGQLPFAARQFVFYHMTQSFRELGWCRGNWKVEQIAADNYSRFAKDLLRDADDSRPTITLQKNTKPQILVVPDDCDVEELPPSSDPPDESDFAPEGNDDADDQSASDSATDERENNVDDVQDLSAKRGAVDEAHCQPETKRAKTSSERAISPHLSSSAHSIFDENASEHDLSRAPPRATQDLSGPTTSAVLPPRSASRRTLTIANTMLDLRFASPTATSPTSLSAVDFATTADPTSPPAFDSPQRATTLARSRSSFRALPSSAARDSAAPATRATRTSTLRSHAEGDADSGDDSDIYVVRLGTHGVGWRSIVGLDFMRDHRNGTTSQFNAYIESLTKREKAEAKRRAGKADLAEMKRLVKALTTKPKKGSEDSDCA